ncbi:MAG: metallophosphoesterase family protein [Bradymonadaceae bacterium]
MKDETTFRIAAVADLHYGRTPHVNLRELFIAASTCCDVLLLCGDLTDHGTDQEVDLLAEDLASYVDVPVLGVLGNHDYDSERPDEVSERLAKAGVQMLDGQFVEIDGVGFAGISGFGGGFDRRALHPFGETATKHFVQATIDEVLKLESALTRMDMEHRVVLLHYAPIRQTVEGEPLEILPFLGSSRLEDPLNHYDVTVAFHGHAHKGSPEGRTTGDVPVYNVSMPLLQRHYPDRPPFRLFEIDRSNSSQDSQSHS